MPTGVTRLIKNTELIKDKIKVCSELANVSGEEKKRLERELDQDYVSLEFLKFLKTFWNQNSINEKKLYLNDLLVDNELHLPKTEQPPKNPEHEARMRKLRAQLDEEEYQRMVANVDFTSKYNKSKNEKISLFPEFRTLQGQLVAIINIVATVGGAFVFGYKAVEYSLDEPDINKQMLAGLVLAIIVAIADIYFLFKKLMDLEEKEKLKTS